MQQIPFLPSTKRVIKTAYYSLLLLLGFNTLAIFAADKIDDSSYETDVIGITEPMLDSDYWQSKLSDGDQLVLTRELIDAKNQSLLDNDQHMNDFSNFPLEISKALLKAKINKLSKKPSGDRFYSDGTKVSSKHYDHYKAALNLDSVLDTNPISFGMVTRRTNMRTFPTDDRIYKTKDSTNLDRFQETGAFPSEVVAIYHLSADKKWYFASNYNYTAWIPVEDVAIGDRKSILNYKNAKDFLIVTGSKVFTSHNLSEPSVSEIQLDMGSRLKLLTGKNKPKLIAGQNTYASHVVVMPTRNENGQLTFKNAAIARSQDVHVGFLPFTKRNLVKQSFKFLGERYGWGHSLNARDCTGFVGEVYKSFGILMPRNSGEQGNGHQGDNIRFTKNASRDEKLARINELKTGDLIYIPGHVMMYLGEENGNPYIIHDVSGLSYYKSNGEYYESQLNGVSVTPLLPLQLNAETSYVDRIYNLKKIR